MAIGSCRKCRSRPRRVRRGIVEPLCEECYQQAMEKVARELAEEAATDGRTRLRKMRLDPMAVRPVCDKGPAPGLCGVGGPKD
jgi:hypothetical protein